MFGYLGAKDDMPRSEPWEDNLGSDNGFVTGVREALLNLNFKDCRCVFVSARIVWIGLFFIE